MEKYKNIIIKIAGVCFINFFLIIIIFICFDLCFYYKTINNPTVEKYFSNYKDKSKKELIKQYVYKDTIERKFFPKIKNGYSQLNPVLLFGDSFVYSNRLNKDETFANILAINSKRPIYDQSTPCVKTQHMLFELQCREFYDIIPKSEFIIYLYVPHHIMETYAKCLTSPHDVFYKFKNNKLVRYENIPFYKKSFFLGRVNARLYRSCEFLNKIYFNHGKDLYRAIMVEAKKEVERHWGDDVKFVIIRYFDTQNPLEDELFEKLKNDGFIVFELYKYIDTKSSKYQIKEKVRPNALLWRTAVPVMMKELGI